MRARIRDKYKETSSESQQAQPVGEKKGNPGLYDKINSEMKEFSREHEKKVSQSHLAASKIVLTS